MNSIYIYLTIAAIISLILAYIIRKIAIAKKLTDIPNERSSHTIPTPRLGGIAILLVWYPGIFLLYIFNFIEKSLFFALLSGILIVIVSIADDIKQVNAKIRLAIHFTASIIAFYFLGGLRQFIIHGIDFDYIFIFYPIVIIGMVWFINLFNFMDGIDGYAGSEAISISFVLFYFSGNLITLLLIAAISGFLILNFSKKFKIFMGDAGSTQLGFILIVLGLYAHNNYDVSILNWLMLAAPFWFDATYTLYRRWRNKEKLSVAHRKHAYQRLVQIGFSHKTVNLILLIANILIFFMILLYREYNFLKVPLTLLTLISLLFIYSRIDKKVPFK